MPKCLRVVHLQAPAANDLRLQGPHLETEVAMFARIAQISPFARHMASYVASEAAAKASRLLVVVAVARTLSPLEIGIAAGALAASDILKALTENGVGQKIIAARDAELDGVCRTAHRLFWAWNIGLFLLQIAIGIGVYAVTGNLMLLVLIVVLASEYLFMPGGMVQCALAMRAGKMHQTAAIAGGQIVGANLMTALLAFVWPSPLALVLPKLICAPIWLIAMRRLHPWKDNKLAKPAPLAPVSRVRRSGPWSRKSRVPCACNPTS